MSYEEENNLAISLGYQCELDSARGGNCCRFVKGIWTVWFCARHWARVKLVKNHYVGHTYHRTLEDALRRKGHHDDQRR